MRLVTPSLVGTLWIATWLMPPVAAAQEACSHWDGSDLHLAGRIGEDEVRAFLESGYPSSDPDGLSGVFIYPKTFARVDSAVALDGTVAGCSIRLKEENSKGTTANWTIRLLDGDRVEGTRTDSGSGATLPVELRRVKALDCTGKGPWRTFRSNKWPITFSYPASWHVSEGDYFELVCPEPSRLAWGGFPITLEQEYGFDPAADVNGKPGQRAGWFVRFDSRTWLRALDDDCDLSTLAVTGCARARAAQRLGMTVVQANGGGEDRTYRPGAGYVGQGGGTIGYLFVHGTRWVQLVSHELPEWSDDIEKGGPARFDGTGVTERLVRSVRLRPTRPPSAPQ